MAPARIRMGESATRYRTGAEGCISHLKRSFGLRRSRLQGEAGMRTWTARAILAYDLHTLAVRAS